jgi:hypothetical protein
LFLADCFTRRPQVKPFRIAVYSNPKWDENGVPGGDTVLIPLKIYSLCHLSLFKAIILFDTEESYNASN